MRSHNIFLSVRDKEDYLRIIVTTQHLLELCVRPFLACHDSCDTILVTQIGVLLL